MKKNMMMRVKMEMRKMQVVRMKRIVMMISVMLKTRMNEGNIF